MTQNQVTIIKWDNPHSRWMVHLESCDEILREKPLLQIGADQFVVLETGGKQLLIKSGVSSILRGKMDPRTIIWLVRTGYDPAVFFSSLATKIYFIDTKEHRIDCDVEVAFPEEKRTFTIPCTLTVRLAPKQIKGLLDQAFDWSDDETINRILQDTVTETVQDVLKQEILNFAQKMPDASGPELKKSMTAMLNSRMLTDLANKANRQLCWKGITLSRRIEINYSAIALEEEEVQPEPEEPDGPAAPEARMEGDFGFFHYRIQATGGAVITGFTDDVSDAVIPDEIFGEPVIGIGEEAFAYCVNLRNARIPKSVTAIGSNAFYGDQSALTVAVDRGSYAEQYCKKNKLRRDY